MRILYAGDSSVGGSANYLLGVLRWLSARVQHVSPSSTLTPTLLRQRYDAVILSDFPSRQAPDRSQALIVQHVQQGAGLLMVGGWASFSGPTGGWRGSRVEQLLPVRCLTRDDRVQWAGGGLIVPDRHHAMFRFLSFDEPPVICGFNAVRPKPGSRVLLRVHRLVARGAPRVRQGLHCCRPSTRFARSRRSLDHPGETSRAKSRDRGRPASVRLASSGEPLLVVHADPRRRIAALTTDLAPHWCGGLVDWGRARVELPVHDHHRVEVGDRYVRWVAALIRWLARADQKR